MEQKLEQYKQERDIILNRIKERYGIENINQLYAKIMELSRKGQQQDQSQQAV